MCRCAAFTHIASLWFVCVCVCVRGHRNYDVILLKLSFPQQPTHTHTLISLFFKEPGIFKPLRWSVLWWPSYKWCWGVFTTCTRDQQHLLLHFTKTKTCWLIFHPKIERKIRNYVLCYENYNYKNRFKECIKYLSIIIAFIAFECIWTRHIQTFCSVVKQGLKLLQSCIFFLVWVHFHNATFQSILKCPGRK